MRLALKLARRGKGLTSPNPCVGAVIVKGGKIIGRGYHRIAGGPHAEICALRQAGKEARGATLYVSLEPCRHYGKTPPCTGAIIASGIKRVVAAMGDPNPINNGKGFLALRKRGIEVSVGMLEGDARGLNEPFIKHISTGMPYVTVKVAQSLDGKIATRTGESKWITGEEALRAAHRLRSEADAILVGVDTVLEDNPSLTVRLGANRLKRQPAKIILDSRLRTPPEAKIFSRAPAGRVIIATTAAAPKEKAQALKSRGAEIVTVRSKGARVDIRSLLKRLGRAGMTHILIEGGGEVIASAFEAGVVDRASFFFSPKIIGGRCAPTSVEGMGIEKLKEAVMLKEAKVKKVGSDFLIEGSILAGLPGGRAERG